MKVHLSDITEKFIAYISTLPKVNYDRVASFISFASTLIEYKSIMLLPKPEAIDESYDGDDISDAELKLMYADEYGFFQSITDKLEKMEILNRFYREPMFGENEFTLVIKDFSLDKMIGAFELLLERIEFHEEQEETKVIEKDSFTIEEKIIQLVEELRVRKKITFFDLFGDNYTKSEVIKAFLALLEILKYQVATCEQNERGGDIIITHAPETDVYDLAMKEEILKDVNGDN
jgi:segregation and condensation protein A